MSNFSKLMSDNSWPKWQVALAVGVPVAFGVGYLYYYKNKDKSIIVNSLQKQSGNLTKKSSGNGLTKSSEKLEEVTVQTPVPLEPLELAEQKKNLGNDFFKSSNYEEAVNCYTEAIESCPKYNRQTLAIYYQNRAAAYERLGDTDKVIEDCTKAIEANDRYVKAIFRRGKAYEKVNRFNLALEDIAVACLLENFQSLDYVTELERIAKQSGQNSGTEYLEKHPAKLPSKFFIKAYMATFKCNSALDKLDTNDDKNNELLQKFREAEELFLAGECEETENRCTLLIRECEDFGNNLVKMEALLLRGTYYTLSKQNPKAIDDLTQVIDFPEADIRVKINALIKRATVHQHFGDPNNCLADFKKAEELDENNADIYHHHGQVYLIMEQLAESVDCFRKSVALDPDFPISVIQHCFAEYKYASRLNDDKNEAHWLKEFGEILRRFPDNMECRTLYAQVLMERQEFSEAEKLFNFAIAKEPNHAALYVHKALLLLQWKAEIEEAKSLIKHAIELDADCEFAYETIATIEMQLGNFEEAVMYYNEAISRYTSSDELYHLCTVRDTAIAQLGASKRLGIRPEMNYNNY